jgi:hypothetical protein
MKSFRLDESAAIRLKQLSEYSETSQSELLELFISSYYHVLHDMIKSHTDPEASIHPSKKAELLVMSLREKISESDKFKIFLEEGLERGEIAREDLPF